MSTLPALSSTALPLHAGCCSRQLPACSLRKCHLSSSEAGCSISSAPIESRKRQRRLCQPGTVCLAEPSSKTAGQDAILSASVPLQDAQQSMQLALEDTEQGKMIVVKSVADGSAAQQNGIAAGQQLLALSQSRGEKLWTLDPQTVTDSDLMRAGCFAWDSLGLSNQEELEIVLSQPEGSSAGAGQSSAEALLPKDPQDPQADGSTIGTALSGKYNQQYPDNPMVSAVERRIKRRKERVEAEKGRNDVPFFLFMLAFFVIPPLVIIVIAYSTGYLDSLSDHYTGTH